MKNITKEDLKTAFGIAKDRELGEVYIGIKVEGHLEVTVIPKESFLYKLEYYNKAYDDDLIHVMNKEVEIIGIALPNNKSSDVPIKELIDLWK